MADLGDFYPTAEGPSPSESVGGRAPAGGGGNSPAAVAGAPALWVIAFVGVSLFLLHVE